MTAPRPHRTVDVLAGEFLDSPYGCQPYSDGCLSRRLAEFLAARHLERIVADRDAFDVVLNGVMKARSHSDPRGR